MKRHLLVVNSNGQVRSSFIPFCAEYGDNWCLSFCLSAEAAIDVCKNNKVDAVISDIDEANFSVLDFFADLKLLEPTILRVLFVDGSRVSKYKNSLGLINTFLIKQSSYKHLDNLLERSIVLHSILSSDESMGNVLASKLPSVPSVYQKLLSIINDETAGMQDVAKLIAHDAAMTTKVLQIVNSSFFGLRRSITNATDATVMLGLETIKGFVLSQQVFKSFENLDIPLSLLEELWNHSLLTAYIARHIVKIENGSQEQIDAAFTAGILHDVGKLVMLEQLPSVYKQYAQAIVKDNQDSVKVEKMIFNTNHALMGAALLDHWGMPDLLIEAVAFHHKPVWYHNNFSIVIAVHVADCLAHEFVDNDMDSLRMNPAALRTANVLLDTRHWREECKINFVT